MERRAAVPGYFLRLVMLPALLILFWSGSAFSQSCASLNGCWAGQAITVLTDNWRIKPGAPETSLDEFLADEGWKDVTLPDEWLDHGYPGRNFAVTYHLTLAIGTAAPERGGARLVLNPGYAHSNIRLFIRVDEGPFEKRFESIDPDGFALGLSGRQITDLIDLTELRGERLDLVFQVSNSPYDNGGFREAPRIGTESRFLYDRQVSAIIHAVFTGSYIILAFYTFVLWRANPDRLEFLWMTGVGVLMSIRLLDTGRILVVTAPGSSIEWNWMIGWSTYYLIGLCMVGTFRIMLQPGWIHWLNRVSGVSLIIGLGLLWFGSSHLGVEYGKLVRFFNLSGFLIGLMLLIWQFRGTFREHGFFLVGLAAVLIGGVSDTLALNLGVEVLHTHAMNLGFLFFVFCITMDLGRQYFLSLGRVTTLANELAVANQSLEKQVADRTVELQNANEQLMALARTDTLTGLPNRRSFDEKLAEELVHYRRFGRPFSIAVLDIDFFKAVNDTHGHDVGDEVLSCVADYLRRELRGTDFVARFGGEEFVILLHETDADTALHLMDRLRERLSGLAFSTEAGDLSVTVSVGISAADQCTDTNGEGLFKLADDALYEAKRTGRNRAIKATKDVSD